MRLKFSLLFTLFVCVFGHIYGQESINSSGGNASGSGGSNSYSVGQVVYITHGSGDTEAQGVQHAYEIYIIDGIEDQNTFSFSVYPNPTTDALVLETEAGDLSNLSFHLTDNNGKLIKLSDIQSSQTIIDMTGLAKSNYFITIYHKGQADQTFKILKQ